MLARRGTPNRSDGKNLLQQQAAAIVLRKTQDHQIRDQATYRSLVTGQGQLNYS